MFGSMAPFSLSYVATLHVVEDWINRRLAEAQAMGRRIAMVRAIHGADVDALSL